MKKNKMVHIKKATISDVDLIASFVFQLLNGFNTEQETRFVTNLEELKKATQNLISRGEFSAYIAYFQNTPVGVITITTACAIYNGGDYGVITELYVLKEHRSQGIGNLLLQSAYQYAKTKNWKKIEVGAPKGETWKRTVSFYEKNGFVKGGPKLRISLNSIK